MADILQYIRCIQMAARGEEVRESLVGALTGMNDSIPQIINEALTHAKASGEFNGADGATGKDGVSPGISVAGVAGGHRITITDALHPSGQSFDVMDGGGSGDMTGSTYDPDNAVAFAGGIPAYVAAREHGKMMASTYDPNNAVARSGGIAAYVAANAQEAMAFDSTPTRYSTNPVTSHGIYTAIQQLISRINTLEERIAELESGSAGKTTGDNNESSVEDNILNLTGASVENYILLLDGSGARVADDTVELVGGASATENILSMTSASVSNNLLIPENGSVSDSILEL